MGCLNIWDSANVTALIISSKRTLLSATPAYWGGGQPANKFS